MRVIDGFQENCGVQKVDLMRVYSILYFDRWAMIVEGFYKIIKQGNDMSTISSKN